MVIKLDELKKQREKLQKQTTASTASPKLKATPTTEAGQNPDKYITLPTYAKNEAVKAKINQTKSPFSSVTTNRAANVAGYGKAVQNKQANLQPIRVSENVKAMAQAYNQNPNYKDVLNMTPTQINTWFTFNAKRYKTLPRPIQNYIDAVLLQERSTEAADSKINARTMAALQGYRGGMTLGLDSLVNKSDERKQFEQNINEAYPVSNLAGKMIGYSVNSAAPDALLLKAAGKFAGQGVAKKALSTGLALGTSNTAQGLVEDTVTGKSGKQIAANAGLNFALGGALGTLGNLAAAQKGIVLPKNGEMLGQQAKTVSRNILPSDGINTKTVITPKTIPTQAKADISTPTQAVTTAPNKTELAYPPTNRFNNTKAIENAGTDKNWDELVDEYGTIKTGENPARQVEVPKQTTDTTKTRQFVRTALEAKGTPDNMVDPIKADILQGKFAYEPINDKSAMSRATNKITRKGFDGALEEWRALVNGRGYASKNDIALGEKLYMEAAAAGDTKLALELVAEIAAEGTRAGQTVQAMRMLKKMTPDGQLYYVRKVVNKLNQDLDKQYKGKVNVNIDEKLADELLKTKTPEELDAAVGKIMENVAEQVPATWMDKWDAWRYLAMLGNPRTHIRNLTGNAIFHPARSLKTLIATGMEKAVIKEGERTKAIIVPKEYKQFAKADYINVKDSITSTGKYNPVDVIREKQTIFKTKWLELARKMNFNLLEKEDNLFLGNAYQTALSRYMKANNLTPEFLKSADGAKVLEKARNIASEEALKATYRDASAFANSLNKFARGNKIARVGTDSLIPFKKTPANLLKRGIEYSPIGVVKGTYDALSGVKKGTKTAAQAIDELAAGLSGTAILGLGAFLASQGIISGKGSDNTKERNFDSLQGIQNYALNIGNTSYTIDWMAPVSLPLFVGVEIYNALQQDGLSPKEVFEGMANIAEPIFNLSMMQGISNTIKAASYSKTDAAITLAETALTGYASQGVPTLLGQIARTVDDTRRTTYIDKNEKTVPAFASKFGQKVAAKTPMLSKQLQPRLDAWGREDKEPSVAMRAFENFISPGYINNNKTTDTEKELERLYKQTGEKSVLPSIASKYVQYNGEKVNFTAKEYTEYAKGKGQVSYNTVKNLLKTPEYKSLSDAGKTDVIDDAYSYANKLAKRGVVDGYDLDGWEAKALKAKQKAGVDTTYFIIYRKMLENEGSRNQQNVKTALDKTKLTEQQKAYIWALEYPKSKNNPY